MTTPSRNRGFDTGPSTDRDPLTGSLAESGVRDDKVASTAPTMLAVSGRPGAIGETRGSAPTAAVGLATGDVLDGVYRVEREIGRGAMGAVYLVEHLGLGRRFAAKVVAADFATNPDLMQRLRNEARIASQIQHENIVDVTHLGHTADGSLFVVMELLEGRDLRDWMLEHSDAPIPFDDIRRIAADVMAGLAAAHDAGIVHRDLKPDNVFLVERQGRSRAKLVDFGISKSSQSDEDLRLTRTGQIMGTPLYMAPEQTRSTADVDARADQYALGVMLYELLAGRLPFVAGHLYDIIVKHATAAPDPLQALRADIPPAVEAVVMRCLAKRPEARFESVHALRAAWDTAWTAPPTAPEAASLAPAAPAPLSLASLAPDAPAPVPPASLAPAPIAQSALELPTSSAPEPAQSTPSHAASQSAAVDAPAPSAPRRTLAFPLGVALALTLLIAAPLTYMALDSDSPAATAAPAAAGHETPPLLEPRPVPEPPPVVAPPGGDVAATQRTLVRRTIHTTPESATVRIGDVDVGTTPYDLEFGAASPITIELRLRGYRRETRTISAVDPDPIAIALRRAAQDRRPELAPR